jgi:hypothetical protein
VVLRCWRNGAKLSLFLRCGDSAAALMVAGGGLLVLSLGGGSGVADSGGSC